MSHQCLQSTRLQLRAGSTASCLGSQKVFPYDHSIKLVQAQTPWIAIPFSLKSKVRLLIKLLQSCFMSCVLFVMYIFNFLSVPLRLILLVCCISGRPLAHWLFGIWHHSVLCRQAFKQVKHQVPPSSVLIFNRLNIKICMVNAVTLYVYIQVCQTDWHI